MLNYQRVVLTKSPRSGMDGINDFKLGWRSNSVSWFCFCAVILVPQSGPKVAKPELATGTHGQVVCLALLFPALQLSWGRRIGAFVISYRKKQTSTHVNHVTSEHSRAGQDGPRVNLQQLLSDPRGDLFREHPCIHTLSIAFLVANISSTSCFYVAMFDPVGANNASSPDAADRDHGKCLHPTTGSIWSSKFSKHIFHRKMASQHPPWHPTGASVPQGPQRHAARMDCFSSESLAVPLFQLIYIHNNKAENCWCTRWNSSILHCSATVFVASK